MPSPFDHRLGYLLRRAQFAYRTALDRALAGAGLTSAQYVALAVLDVEPGLSNAALARRCQVTPQTMHTVVRGLEAAGWAARTPHATHGRIQETRLTDAGRVALRAAHVASKPVERRLAAALPDELRPVVAAALRTCAAGMEERSEGVEG